MRFAFALVTGLVVAGALHAQPAPTGPAPALKIVRSVDKKTGHIVFNDLVTRRVAVMVPKVMIVNGQQVTFFETQYKTETAYNSIQAANSRVITPDGKQLPIDEVWKRLKPNTVVAVSADGNAPAAAYLKALRADTLVVIPPPTVVGVPPPTPKLIPPPKKG